MLNTFSRHFLCLLLMAITSLSIANTRLPANTTSIGTLENVAIDDLGMIMPARIDTGAGMTSVNADIIKIKPGKNGAADTVLFNLSDHKGNAKILEKNIERWIRIKNKGSAGYIKRPVVVMNYCLGGKQIEGHTNLANRSRFLYPVLIGRNLLGPGDYIIHADKKFMHDSSCSAEIH